MADSYSNKEYFVDLIPDDIRDIKNYNKDVLNMPGSLGYIDRSINADGDSGFLEKYGFDMDPGVQHYKLGEGE